MKGIVVAGIGTGVGKTFIATILTEALEADYWKPVQSGNLDYTDTDFVRQHISNSASVIHPEAYRFTQPISPHAAAPFDGIEIEASKLSLPNTLNKIVIELAGGLMVPLNSKFLNIDLLRQWELPVVLVSENYLGSINHTLLTVYTLRQNDVTIAGIIFNGGSNEPTENFILNYTGLNCIAHIGREKKINKAVIKKYADLVRKKLEGLL